MRLDARDTILNREKLYAKDNPIVDDLFRYSSGGFCVERLLLTSSTCRLTTLYHGSRALLRVRICVPGAGVSCMRPVMTTLSGMPSM